MLEFLTGDEAATLAQCIDFLTGKSLSIEFLAASYNLIAGDTLAEQAFFMEHGKYRHTTFEQVGKSVYGNPEYMEKYMYGLMLTGFLWKNHVLMNRWFEEKIPADRAGRYLEIGPGHGYHILTAMRRCSFDTYEGIDISATSVALTREILSHFFPETNRSFNIFEADFLAHEFDRQFDAVIMGEVLEHVERPAAFLQKIARIAGKEAFIYITTAINAPAIDHIYLFDSPRAVEDIVKQAGLSVKDQLLVPYRGMTLGKSLKLRLPVTIALVIG
jgi:ubiquinone/menaquinone biosynthesis C-methylase UbiE